MTGSHLGRVEHVACIHAPGEEAVEDVRKVSETVGVSFDAVTVGNEPELKENSLGVAVGGDGTFLESVQVFAPHDVPFLAVSGGSLGFLARIDPVNSRGAVTEAVEGDIELIERALVEVSGPEVSGMGINEVRIEPLPPEKPTDRKICHIHVWIAGEYAGAYRGDGIAVATPTGSTGLALSAGGPIHHPADADVLQVTPILTHSTGVRPIIVDADKEVKIRPDDDVRVNVDGGRVKKVVEAGTKLSVTGSEGYANIVRTSYDESFFDALVDGLGWPLRELHDPGPGESR